MELGWKGVILFLTLCGAAESCVSVDSRPSWSLEVPPAESTRRRREVSLSERMGCGVVAEAPPAVRFDSTVRAASLIELMKSEDLDAYIIPSSDEHMSEYVSDDDARRQFITGFTGSAGTAVVLADGRRALWTDGRYFLQADQQLDCTWLLMKELNDGVPTILEWLKESLSPFSVVGADPKLISAMEWVEYEEKLKDANITMRGVETDLIDAIWAGEGKPPKKVAPIEVLGLEFAGLKWEDKVLAVRKEMNEERADMIIITAMDEVAWLFNLRGGDIPFNPVFKSYAIIDGEKIRLFLDQKIRAEVDLHLRVNQCDQECVEIYSYKTVVKSLEALSSLDNVKKVLLPSKYSYSGGASYAIYSSVPKEKRIFAVSPVLLMKARKNQVESQGMRTAHVKDAVALVSFLSFLDDEIKAGNSWTEVSAAEKLEEFRAEEEHYRSPSFETISAFGSNGAIIHYRPTPETDVAITNESLYLLDSGGQYNDGTTDVTRTLHYGTPTEFQKEVYTRVLKGAIDVASLVFPKGTKDTRIDVLARRSLYEVGLDYQHGTGHGIGMFLNIHEAPTQMRIYGTEEHDLEVSQFFSDEPGYYKAGDFGVRLETIITVVPKKVKYDDFPMLGFEPVTLVPFEPKLIDLSLLDNKQCEYLNTYHAQVREVIGPALDAKRRPRAKAYMMERTEPLDCNGAGIKETAGSLQKNRVEQNNAGVQSLREESQHPASGALGARCSLVLVSLAIFSSYLVSR